MEKFENSKKFVVTPSEAKLTIRCESHLRPELLDVMRTSNHSKCRMSQKTAANGEFWKRMAPHRGLSPRRSGPNGPTHGLQVVFLKDASGVRFAWLLYGFLVKKLCRDFGRNSAPHRRFCDLGATKTRHPFAIGHLSGCDS